jgi:charged multivesicular body protein 6
LKQQRDKLKQYQKRIELSLEKDREIAKKLLASGRKEFVSVALFFRRPLIRLSSLQEGQDAAEEKEVSGEAANKYVNI